MMCAYDSTRAARALVQQLLLADRRQLRRVRRGRAGRAEPDGELLSLPGTLVLFAVTAISALVIFAPARTRLRELEQAAGRFGAGELGTRAPAQGSDEIARVAEAFNHMASDLEERTEALQVSDRLRRQMLADISHELRTPLTTMRGYLDTLDIPEIVLDEDKRRRYVDTARRETIRLERIVADPNRLDQALSNLVVNALRHIPPGGAIQLEACGDSQRL